MYCSIPSTRMNIDVNGWAGECFRVVWHMDDPWVQFEEDGMSFRNSPGERERPRESICFVSSKMEDKWEAQALLGWFSFWLKRSRGYNYQTHNDETYDEDDTIYGWVIESVKKSLTDPILITFSVRYIYERRLQNSKSDEQRQELKQRCINQGALGCLKWVKNSFKVRTIVKSTKIKILYSAAG